MLNERLNVILVSSKIPPDHSGAGKRIYSYFNYLKDHPEFNPYLITHSPNRDENVIRIKSFKNRGFTGKVGSIITFIYSLFKLTRLHGKKPILGKTIIWLTSAQPLTFAAVVYYYLKGAKIITQNTLLGSDDPEAHYPGDFLNLKFLMKRLQYKLSDYTTSNSKALYKITRKYNNRNELVPNPVDLDKFKPKYGSVKRRRFKNILIVGRLSYRKGFDIIFRTIEKIHSKDPSIHFTFLGPINVLENVINKFDFNDDLVKSNIVNFEGYVSDTRKYYMNSSIFFLPSRREGFPTVFIEAMACGLPVVAKKLNGLTDYIFGSEYSTIINGEDPNDYATIILNLLQCQYEYDRLVELGYNKVKRFDKDVIFKRYDSLIEKVFT